MVFFICNACGETIKKNQVENHYLKKCRNCEVLSCMDCHKDFRGDAYKDHTKCITEEEKYSKPGQKPKVENKQEVWTENIRIAAAKKVTEEDLQLKKLVEEITNQDNIPRKEDKFKNFLTSHLKVRDRNLIERALEIFNDAKQLMNNNASKKEKDTETEENKQSTNKKRKHETENGNTITEEGNEKEEMDKSVSKKQKNKKRKHEAEKEETNEVNGEEEKETCEPKQNGQKPKNKKQKRETENGNVSIKELNGKEEKGETETQPINKKSKNKKSNIETSVSEKSANEENVKGDLKSESDEKQSKKKNRKGKQSDEKDTGAISESNGISEEIAETEEKPTKFKWRKVAESVLLESDEKSMPLKKLKKRILKAYKKWSPNPDTVNANEIHKMIEEKLFKQKFQLDNENVKLIC